MKMEQGKKRCTKVEEVIEHITGKAIQEYYKIWEEKEKAIKQGKTTSKEKEHRWVDKYYVNPHKVNNNNISFLVIEERKEVIFVFDKNYNIENIYVRPY